MKNLNNYIEEGLKLTSKLKINTYNYHPQSKRELFNLINKLIKERGNEADLNDIDVSGVTDMAYIFDGSNKSFNGDISEWNVSNVVRMTGMFSNSDFTGDISKWDVTKVKDMNNMFYNSNFNGDLSQWDVSNVEDMNGMFYGSTFNGDISKWDVSNVTKMSYMFYNSKFTGENGDISKWNTPNVKYKTNTFKGCPLEKNPPKWYKK